ncbi:hypothetical protein [Blastococcus sp. SYSU D00695]
MAVPAVTTLAPTVSDRRPVTPRAVLPAAAVVLLTGAGCAGEADGTVCPPVGWLDAVTVHLAAGWSLDAERTVTVTCDRSCAPSGPDGGSGNRESSAPLAGSTATVPVTGQPSSVVVTVLVAGHPRAVVPTDLDWRRVGGSEECGGPRAAAVTVPAP